MKKFMMLAIAAMAFLAVSCQKEKDEELPTFTAHADNGGMKTDLVGNLIHWNSSDQVKMFGDFGYAIYSVTPRSDDPTWATLSPISSNGLVGLAPYRFVYPASMAEGGTENNSTLYVTYPAERDVNDAPLTYYPMYGESDNHDVAFRNLGGLVKIVLPQIDREVAYIRIAADEAITGKYSFASDCSTMSHVAGTAPDTSIVISVNGNIAEGDEVYVAVPNSEYHNFAITIVTTDNYVARKTGSLVNVAQSAITTIAVSNLSFTAGSLPAATLMERAFYYYYVQKPIVFHYNYDQVVEGAERIDDGQNETPIWRKTNTNSVDIYTPAAQINAPANCYNMFCVCTATSIDFGNGFNTSNVTNMYGMFSFCTSLTSLDLSSFNTENVTNMSWMFYYCSSLTSLDLSSFNTENVTEMKSMFQGCQSLTSLNLSSFNTSNVTDMRSLFEGCPNLTSLDLSSFNTENVTNMRGMFRSCNRLTSLDLSSFSTSNVSDMIYMFSDCQSLTSLDLSSFNTSNVTDMRYMFYECRKLTSLDLSSFNTSNVTDMSYMFYDCFRMASIEFASNTTINNSANVSFMLYDLGTYATGGCTIHCNGSVKNRLMSPSSYSQYNATYVHFNTVY